MKEHDEEWEDMTERDFRSYYHWEARLRMYGVRGVLYKYPHHVGCYRFKVSALQAARKATVQYGREYEAVEVHPFSCGDWLQNKINWGEQK